MPVAAPGLLRITTCCPGTSLMAEATGRISTSAGQPAAFVFTPDLSLYLVLYLGVVLDTKSQGW